MHLHISAALAIHTAFSLYYLVIKDEEGKTDY